MNKNPVQKPDFASATEFLSAISRRSNKWQPSGHALIYRGQAEPWPLLPGAHRPGAFPENKDDRPIKHVMARHESNALISFIEQANDVGLHFPGPAMNFDNLERAWPHEKVLPALALAQHHGILTRLLDWSTKPEVGAYFAAKDASRTIYDLKENIRQLEHANSAELRQATVNLEDYQNGAMEIVALNRSYVNNRQRSINIEVVICSRSENPNLLAQSGMLTVDYELESRDNRIIPFDEVIQERVQRREPREDMGPAIQRMTLTRREAPRLLRELARDGFHAATLFPSYDGVVQSINERKYWET